MQNKTKTPCNYTNDASLVSFIQASTDAVKRSVKSRLDESIYVTDYVPDQATVTDWQPALQSAIDEAASSGHPVYMPPGILHLSSPLLIVNPENGFCLYGAGKGVTILKRNGDFSIPVSFSGCSHMYIGDFSIDGSFDTIPENASHGLSMNKCSDFFLERVGVYNYRNTGIIHITPNDNVLRERVVLMSCDTDGMDVANNGIALSTVRMSGMINCNALRVGKVGSPCYALQLKNVSDRNFIIGGTAEGAAAGIAMGQEINHTAVTNSIVSNVRVLNCTQSMLLGYAENNVFGHLLLDQSGRDGIAQGLRAISMNECYFNTITATIKNVSASSHAVRLTGNSSDNVIEIPMFIDTAGIVAPFFRAQGSATRNSCRVSCKTGSYPATSSDHKQESDTDGNLFYYQDRPRIGPTLTIISNSIPSPPLDADFLRIKTEDAATTDNLTNIGAGVGGQRIIVGTANSNHDVTVISGVGNIRLSGAVNFTLNQTRDRLCLMFDDLTNEWCEFGRSDN
ncbi:glycosyl hydrolase family 28-related protein [Luteimonas sp. R10]|uniref:glycosyl hydrolase family 28-related protein n=1 Tax=Luteimonas sp. R10 TaxID=3108176 RepID=UPI00309177A8|nr:glycosyl hydrolase family 28-related protein [Luteimonas sp. R10]